MTTLTEKLKLVLGFHCHLPSDIHKIPVENDFIKSYNNFIISIIDNLSRTKNIKATIHFSGSLINHLDKKYPDFSSKVLTLLDQNKIELLSGGMYDPIFPFIPKDDRQAQLSLMSRFINHTYGYLPNGAWLTEYAWEPSLAVDLSKSRVQYICLPKEYFLSAGINEENLSGYFVTEDEGRKVGVFPVNLKLDELIKQFSPEEAVKFILDKGKSVTVENPLLVVFFEGIKGIDEPNNWLKDFFSIIDSKTEEIETKLINNFFTGNKPSGRIYLPTKQDIKSENIFGTWKNFLIKYHEANLLHKKMLRVSKKINSAKEGKSRFKVIKEMITQAHELLLKGQSNDIYWDTILGGIYSPRKRHNAYSNLIKAENLIDAASQKGPKWIQLSEIDYDCDGNDEIIIESETQNIYISPALGGSILEHDYKPRNLNLTNVFSRRFEPYHKESNNSNGDLIYDEYTKLSVIEHFLADDITLEKCQQNKLNHLTKKNIYSYHVDKIKAKEESCKVTFDNIVKLLNSAEIELKKQITVRSGDASTYFDYSLMNTTANPIKIKFAIEFNLNLSSNYDEKSYFYLGNNKNNKTQNPNIETPEEIASVNEIALYSNHFKADVLFFWTKPCTLYKYPIETLSYNYGKLGKVYQGTTLLPVWDIVLEPGMPYELSIKQTIDSVSEEH